MQRLYKDIYEFASSAGAFEGYVYQRENLKAESLDNWVKNLVKQYHALPADIRQAFQPPLDRTLGRAVQSLVALFGADHAHVLSLKSLVAGKMPDSPDDFEKEKAGKA